MEAEPRKPRTTAKEIEATLEQFALAMQEVRATLARGSSTHRANEWKGETPEFHLIHAALHLVDAIASSRINIEELIGRPNSTLREWGVILPKSNDLGGSKEEPLEDDLAHAATRLLMALEVRSAPL